MSLLNKICSYWYDCIKNEDALERDIIIGRSKAILCPFDEDSFIFRKKDLSVTINNERLNVMANSNTEGVDFFYGYPLLFYRDNDGEKVAPLFVIKIVFKREETGLVFSRGEAHPTCGIKSFKQLGLTIEQIAQLNEQIEKIFDNVSVSDEQLMVKVFEIIRAEITISFGEEINPLKLTNSTNFSTSTNPGLFNKSIIFVGESTNFNIHLIKDLLSLKTLSDLDNTSLSFFSASSKTDIQKEIIPILPFPSNEYQLSAIKDIFKQSLSVITGPPGTGKSQFISNLIVNLFLAGKSVLFVSHTGEAVDVVNLKINEQFKNLMLRSGNKANRQELRGRFSELIAEFHKKHTKTFKLDYIHSLWKIITANRVQLLRMDEMEQEFQQKYFYQEELRNILKIQGSLFRKTKIYLEVLFLSYKLNRLKNKLSNQPTRMAFESKIKELENKYYVSCREYVRNVYVKKMFGNGNKTGIVNSFINQIHGHRVNDDDLDDSYFNNALQILKIWSCTLKSLRSTFPLNPNIFDYVIFDEASQIDLPSAAPALYRAKKAIVVGDPMQLTHIPGISKRIDTEIAKLHGLYEMKDIYPAKIGYFNTSLYKAAENSLPHPPLQLNNHYRSEDQIISLCNKVFYEGRLKILSTLDYNKFPFALPLGIQWEDVKGEVYKLPAGSRINMQEVNEVCRIFQNVLKEVSGKDLSIGIVTPYSGQRHEISKKINNQTPSEILLKHDVKVLTAHQFQGSEKDIVIFSLVLSEKGLDNSDSWYNKYPQILNVALSRARYLLYIVGDKYFCEKQKGILGKLKDVYQEIKDEQILEKNSFDGNFDTPTERFFYEQLQKIELEKSGYKLVPKLVVKRYTLDFAIVGEKKINIEIDGIQHEIIEGLPIVEDVDRDAFLIKDGWRVLRFANHRVLSEMPMILEELLMELK